MWYERFWLWAKEHLTITVPGVVFVFTAAWVLMLAVQNGAVGAAWVQAFGSIGAILAATYIASNSRRVEEARERKKDAVIGLALLYRVEEAKSTLYTLSLFMAHSYNAHHTIDRHEATEQLDLEIRSLLAVDLFTLPSPHLVNALIETISQLDDARWIAGALDLPAFIERGGNLGPFAEHIDKVETLIKVIREIADA